MSCWTAAVRRLSLALVLTVLLGLPMGARADLNFVIVGNTVTITGYSGAGGAVTVPDTLDGLPVTRIGNNAFHNHAEITGVSLGRNLIEIGRSAFESCTALAHISIPDSVVNIGDRAFLNCSSLTHVEIGSGGNHIANDTFHYCSALGAITVSPENPVLSSADGVLFDRNQTRLLQCPWGRTGTLAIPGTTTEIGTKAFYNCASLNEVLVPDSVTVIGDGAFHGCMGLTNLVLGRGITTLGSSAFWDCMNLPQITLAPGIMAIGDNTFFNCTRLSRVTLGGAIATLGSYSFFNCTNLTTLVIPSSVSRINEGAFYACTHLDSVFFEGSPPAFGPDLFGGGAPATVYRLPGSPDWGTTYAGRPVVLWNPSIQSSDPDFGASPGGFRLPLTGTPDIPIVVDAATRLDAPLWTPLYSGALTHGAMTVLDPDWNQFPTRLYRIRTP